MMNCQQAVMSVITSNAPAMAKKLDANQNGGKKFPRLWKGVEHFIAHKYERETGVKIGAGFDWATILEWLKTVLPLILKIITLFGA